MEVRPNLIIPLGYGKYFRSDKIVGLEPIEEDRGPGRRTKVYIDGLDTPVIASRTGESIVGKLVEIPDEVLEATAAFELLEDILNDLAQVGPMLRKCIRKEGKIDLDRIEHRIRRILSHEIHGDIKQ
ncbi:MAG: hypothetical protein ACOX6S_13555 [Clostridia bacterium]|jgi:hypothetical protein